MRSEVFVGLDVGTSKVCAVVAELSGNGASILGIGEAPSTGLRKGIVINMDETVAAIRRAVREAEASAGIGIHSVSAGISGGHVQTISSNGATGIAGRHVRKSDKDRAIESARAVYIPLDREVLHVLPQEYILDGQDGITEPLGMSGVRLEARVLIVTCTASAVENLAACCERAGLDVEDVVFSPVASAEAVLSADERESGVVLVDMGGGTTDIALFKGGGLRHAAVLGVGGAHVTNDIAVGFRVNVRAAEELKKASASAYRALVSEGEEIMIQHADGNVKTVPGSYLAEIIQPRCEEMLDLVKQEIKACLGYELAVCGAVLTGGASLLRGFDKMAEATLGLPVRIGIPRGMRGLASGFRAPAYAAAIGLACREQESELSRVVRWDLVGALLGKVRGWYKNANGLRAMVSENNRRKGEWHV